MKISETRLIDANRFIKCVEKWKPYIKTSSVIVALERFKAADAVEVVRCKDCKYYSQNPWNDEEELLCKCWADWIPTEPDDFCSQGERVEDG